MAHPSPGRKGWRRALALLGLLGVSAVVAFPITFFGTFLLSPLLGRLEARYGIELVGHSGPADWIFELVFGIGTAAVFGILVLISRTTRRRS